MRKNSKSSESGPLEPVFRECVAVLQRMANYRLPAKTGRRMLWLGENKAALTPSEKKEYFALVELSEDLTLEKVKAQFVLKQLADKFPHLKK